MPQKFNFLVKTGDQKYAGTDSNVYVILLDDCGFKSPILKLDKPFHDDLEKGNLDRYDLSIPPGFNIIEKLHLWKDSKGFADGWFCDYIIVQDPRGSECSLRKIKNARCPGIVESNGTHKVETYFPIFRWISPEHKYIFEVHATCLPQFDPQPGVRIHDIEYKKQKYIYKQNVTNGPSQISDLPKDETFSDKYFWNFATEKVSLLTKCKFIEWTMKPWKSMDELKRVVKKSIGEPECAPHWDQDWWFGIQRLQGVNPVVIQLCKEIPEKFGVTDEMVMGLIEEKCLADAASKNKLFICDLHILHKISCKDNRKLADPIVLFYLRNKTDLMPIAIQLMQNKGPKNPVYTPKDPLNTWLVAKMYYNNAEAQHHQGLTHLGLTHLLMEGVCICTHRNLAPTHPMFKLMAPHFLFLLAINCRGLQKLISPGGWVDGCMTQGVVGIFELIIRGLDQYNMKISGNIAEECKSRGVLDPEILPYYPYRDDAVDLFKIIRNYVSKIVVHYYDSEEKLKKDSELQEWRLELGKPRNEGGVGMDGIPGDNEKGFECVEDLIETVAIIVSTCSLGHSAANFQQYEQYAFVPNYPGILNSGPPPEKLVYTEEDILHLLPDMRHTLDIVVITKLLSSRGTKSLGDFEMQYLFDPADVQAVEEFKKELKKLSFEIKRRNIDRKWPFPYLDPEIVPNAISI